MTRILIVEDEHPILRLLTDFLKSEGYEVLTARDGAAGLDLAVAKNPGLIILDIMLPKKSGYDVCRELRAKGSAIPIIMLTAKGEEVDKVLGLELGADDYITKPFGLKELHARIRAILRRGQDPKGPNALTVYELGHLRIDLKGHVIMRGHKHIALSSLEVNLLAYFIQNRGIVVSREELLNKVWGYDRYPTTRTIDTHILNLRKKIETDPAHPQWLLTVHGTGYQFVG